jgi:hypothetical protein
MLQSDGNLVAYGSTGHIWASNTVQPTAAPTNEPADETAAVTVKNATATMPEAANTSAAAETVKNATATMPEAANTTAAAETAAPMSLHPAVRAWAEHSEAYQKKVAGVIKHHGPFGGNPEKALDFIRDLAGKSKELVDTLGTAGASLPNSLPFPLCAHATRDECVSHRGCAWDTYRHCFTSVPMTMPQPQRPPRPYRARKKSKPGDKSKKASKAGTPMSYQFQLEHALTPASPYDGKASG